MAEVAVGVCCKAQTAPIRLEVLASSAEVTHVNSASEYLNCQGCRIKSVLDYIQATPIEYINLDAAAAVLRISPSRFRHLFKDYVGISFHQYIIALRLERARYLLRTTSYTVERIAGMLGIQDLSHFARDFKKVYGISPGATRCEVANMIARNSHNSHNGHL